MLTSVTILTVLGTVLLTLTTLRLVKIAQRPKAPSKPKVKALDAVLLWAKGDLDHKEAAMGYLGSYLSDAFLKYIALGVESPTSFKFEKKVYQDSDYTHRTMFLAENTKAEYAMVIYDPTRSTSVSWSNTKKLVTGTLALERDTVLYVHFKTDAKGDNVTVTYEEKPESKDGINALVLKVINTIASRSLDSELTPVHKVVLGLLTRYPAEAVRFLDDPIFSEHAKKIVEGVK